MITGFTLACSRPNVSFEMEIEIYDAKASPGYSSDNEFDTEFGGPDPSRNDAVRWIYRSSEILAREPQSQATRSSRLNMGCMRSQYAVEVLSGAILI